jgi:hypothetical protein
MSNRPSDLAYKFEAVKVALRQDKSGYVLSLSIHPNDIPEELMRDWVGSRFIVAMVPIGDDEKPVDKPSARAKLSAPIHPDGVEAVRLAGILCREPAFQNWIGAPGDEDRAAEVLKLGIQIESRAELGDDPDARDRFYAFLDQYRDDLGISPAKL